MAANMYRVGDYVYFENSSSNPYLIRRIEELNKTASGNVEAKVVCFYRRRDISNTLIMLADKHAKTEFCSCCPGWSAVARSWLTATSTSQIK
ncbi:MTA3 isoform 14 [Pongo abelii]|uniref:MTA3 isoform 14 n=1 Tax=Pongo abelii TaxID=9601 RepID=A0A2J8XDI0_PONAB|nr:MTA3 isoform 14 [Pongo abelii]